jgi:hypothetical protein
MKTKKYLIAIAIFGGILFTTQAVNASQDEGKIDKKDIRVPKNG